VRECRDILSRLSSGHSFPEAVQFVGIAFPASREASARDPEKGPGPDSLLAFPEVLALALVLLG
jgi:hypothetical protein